MPRYIDANKLYSRILASYTFPFFIGEYKERDNIMSHMISYVVDAPTEEVKPIIKGKWILINDYVDIGDGCHMECSVCHTWKQDRIKTNFCPHCGADLRS